MSKYIHGKELVDEVYEELDYPIIPVRKIIFSFLRKVKAHLEAGDNIDLLGVGKWTVKKARQYKTPGCGKVEERYAYRYTPYRAVEQFYASKNKEGAKENE